MFRPALGYTLRANELPSPKRSSVATEDKWREDVWSLCPPLFLPRRRLLSSLLVRLVRAGMFYGWPSRGFAAPALPWIHRPLAVHIPPRCYQPAKNVNVNEILELGGDNPRRITQRAEFDGELFRKSAMRIEPPLSRSLSRDKM